MPLSDPRRSQLDGIVRQMIQNKETDSDVQFVVNDFIGKYQGENQVTQPQARKGFVQKASGFLGVEKFGQGIAGAYRTVTGEVGQDIATQQGADRLTQQLVQKARPETDLVKKRRLLEVANRQGGQSISATDIDPTLNLSNKEVLGSALNTATTVLGVGSLPGAKATGFLSKVPGLTKGAPLAKTVAGKTAEGLALGYASDVGQKASQNKDNVFTPGLGTGIGGGLPLASKLIGALAKRGVAMTTGAGNEVINRAIHNPDAVGDAIQEYAKTNASKQALVSRARTAIYDFLDVRKTEFGESVSKTTFTKPFSKQEIVNSFSAEVKRFRGKLTKEGIAFNSTSLTPTDQRNLNNFWKQLYSWTDFTPSGVENLRQAIGNNIDEFKALGNTRADVALGGLKKFVSKGLTERSPGYGDILKTYGRKTQLAKDVLKELNLSGNAKSSTQLNSIMRVFKKDPKIVDDLTKIMGPEEADNLLNDISGAILSEWLPSGATRRVIEGLGTLGGVYGAATGAVSLPTLAGAAATASPRIVGKGAVMVGKGLQKGIGTGLRRATTIGSSKLSE